MSTADPTQRRPPVREFGGAGDVAYAEDRSSGWLAFAAVMLGLLAVLNFIDGVAAVSTATFFVGDAEFVISDLKTWGWVLIAISLVQGLTAFGVWAQWTGVRWVGVAIASLNAIAQMIVMPAYPLWAISLFAVDVLVIYALVVHGARRT
jgi:hypothetical protein